MLMEIVPIVETVTLSLLTIDRYKKESRLGTHNLNLGKLCTLLCIGSNVNKLSVPKTNKSVTPVVCFDLLLQQYTTDLTLQLWWILFIS